jgi:hypothetical protein
LRQVADLDAEGGEELPELGELLLVGIVVHAVERGQVVAAGEAGDGLVGEEHEFLDELVALVVVDELDAVSVAGGVDEDFGLRHVEIEAAAGMRSRRRRLLANRPELADPFLQFGEFGVGSSPRARPVEPVWWEAGRGSCLIRLRSSSNMSAKACL